MESGSTALQKHGIVAVFIVPDLPTAALRIVFTPLVLFTDGAYTKRTRAHKHRELIREWLWEPNVSSPFHRTKK